MKNRLYLIATIALAIILIILSVYFIIHSNKLKNQIGQTNSLLQKIESELSSTIEEKDRISKANEKLQADSLSYLAINAKLSDEKEQLNKKLENAQRILETKEANLQRAQRRLAEIEKMAVSAKTHQDEKLAREKRALEKKIIKSAKEIKKERSLYHYNLGVAYAQAKLYSEAIEEYEKSTKFDPQNSDTYYNLGVLYETIEADAEKAIENFRKYLELNPAPEDVDDVRERIKRLGG